MRPSVLLAVPFLLILAGCATHRANPVIPLPESPVSAQALAPGIGPGEQLMSGWQVTVDPATLSATMRFSPDRASQVGTQGRMYDLDISRFLTNDTLAVAGVKRDVNGDLLLTIIHRHPFPAPDFAGAISAMNRADLSYTGRLLVLTDTAHAVFAAPANLEADPTLVRDPDGYAAVGDLLLKKGFTNNLFPYMLLVDEAKDNRIGISNGGNPKGNYDAANGGWQQGNAGTGNVHWTGYDYLHGGQAVTCTIALQQSALTGTTPASFGLALLVKYSDPRGVASYKYRMPVAPPDPLQFAYRLPQAALDVGRCETCDNWLVFDKTGQTVPVDVTIRDWDAGATEAADGDLSTKADVGLILPGASGAPAVTAFNPDLNPNPIPLTLQSGSGLPGDEYRFSGNFVTDLPSGSTSADTHYLLITATDPEDSTPDEAAAHFGVDPSTLVASSSRARPLRSYALIPVTVHPYDGWAIPFPSAGPEMATGLAVAADGTIAVTYLVDQSAVDLDPGPCVNWQPTHGLTDGVVAWLDPAGSLIRAYRLGGSGNDGMSTCLFDGTGALTVAGVFNSDDFDIDPGPGTTILNRAGANFPTFLARFNADGTLAQAGVLGQNAGDTTVIRMAKGNSSLALIGDYRGTNVDLDPTGGQALFSSRSPTTDDPFMVQMRANGSFDWARTWDSTTAASTGDGVAYAGNGDLLLCGYLSASPSVDLDPTSGVDTWNGIGGSDVWLERLGSDGSYVWGRLWGSDLQDQGEAIGELTSTTGFICGTYQDTADFDPGPGTDLHTAQGGKDIFLCQYDAAGTYLHGYSLGSSNEDGVGDGRVAPDGSLFLVGAFAGTMDFNPAGGDPITPNSPGLHPFVLHLGSDLSFQWVTTLDCLGPTGSAVFERMDVGADLAPVAVGFFMGGLDVNPNPQIEELDSPGSYPNLFVDRLRPEGGW